MHFALTSSASFLLCINCEAEVEVAFKLFFSGSGLEHSLLCNGKLINFNLLKLVFHPRYALILAPN